MSLLRLGCRKGDQSWCTRRCRCIIPCTQTHSPHTTLIPPLLPDIYPASLNARAPICTSSFKSLTPERFLLGRTIHSGIHSSPQVRRLGICKANNLYGAAQRDVFAGGWLLKKVMILFFLCLWLQSAKFCKNPPKRWTKPNLTALTLQRMLMIEREGGCRFSIHWQRGTVGNFSNRLIWKPRWSFCSIALYYISLLSGLGNIWWSKQKSKCEWQR